VNFAPVLKNSKTSYNKFGFLKGRLVQEEYSPERVNARAEIQEQFRLERMYGRTGYPYPYTPTLSGAGRGMRTVQQQLAYDQRQAYLAKQRQLGIAAARRNFAPLPMGGLNAAKVRAQIAEKKGMDTDVTLSPVIATTNTNGSSFVLNLIQQGAGSWNRVGRKAHLKSLRLKGNFIFTQTPTFATGTQSSNFVRTVVIWDQQPSGAAIPNFDTIFGITDQTGAESCPDILNPPRYDNMDRFKILLDRTCKLMDDAVPAFGTGPNTTSYEPFDYFLRLKGRESVFLGQSNPMTIADISTGAVYVFFRALTNQANSTVGVDGITRLRYTD